MLHLRKQVDLIDQRLLQLLQQRTKLSGEIGKTKRRHGAEIYVPDRERELIARVAKLSNGSLPSAAVGAIFREILSCSRAAQGQPPIGVLSDSGPEIYPMARCHFGACDQFIAARDWPDLARQLMLGRLAIGLLTFADLAAALGKRWRPGIKITGEISPAGGASGLRESLFILRPSDPPPTGNRALILIECKPTANAVKSLVNAMPHAPQLVQLAPFPGRSKGCLAALTFDVPVTREKVADVGVVLGIYPADESYGG